MGGHWFMLQLRGLILFLPSQELILRALPITPLPGLWTCPGLTSPTPQLVIGVDAPCPLWRCCHGKKGRVEVAGMLAPSGQDKDSETGPYPGGTQR